MNEVFEQDKIKIAKELIRDFLMEEYEHKAEDIEFTDLTHIPIAHTTTEDGEHDIDIVVDLKGCNINKHLDGELVEGNSFKDIHDLVEKELVYLNFSELVYLEESIIDSFKKKSNEKIKSQALGKGDLVKTASSDNTMVLAVEKDDALLFDGNQYILAHGIERDELETDKVSWAYGSYYQDFPDDLFGKKKENNFSGDLTSFLEDNYKKVVKSLVSMDLNIHDEEILEEMYDRFMDRDDMRLINDEFEEIEYDIEDEWDMEV